MANKKREINPLCGIRLNEWIQRIGMSKSELAGAINYSQPIISNVINGKKNMSVEFARLVSENTSQGMSRKYNVEIKVRPSYLLGFDDFMTTEDYETFRISHSNAIDKSTLILLDNAVREVTYRNALIKGMAPEELKKIEFPVLDNIPDILFLQAQLKDYANSLVWTYLTNRETSQVWSMLDERCLD